MARAGPIHLPGAVIRIGTGGWTDPRLTAPGVFYPRGANTPEARLRYYASRFSMVEVDTTYYAIPSRETVEHWAERTPADFMFHVKAHALMTGQPSEVNRLPAELRAALPRELAEAQRVYAKDLPPAIREAIWKAFVDAVEPLRASGKLGAVLLQYPHWFVPRPGADEALLEAKARMAGLPIAVEFRNRRWLDERHADRTVDFLASNELPLVAVDAPQGLQSSMPPVAAVTSARLLVLRLHGRRVETWQRRNVTVAERYRYLYEPQELMEWVRVILQAAPRVHTVTVVLNNCYANYGTTNAFEIAKLLLEIQPEPPVSASRRSTGAP